MAFDPIARATCRHFARWSRLHARPLTAPCRAPTAGSPVLASRPQTAPAAAMRGPPAEASPTAEQGRGAPTGIASCPRNHGSRSAISVNHNRTSGAAVLECPCALMLDRGVVGSLRSAGIDYIAPIPEPMRFEAASLLIATQSHRARLRMPPQPSLPPYTAMRIAITQAHAMCQCAEKNYSGGIRTNPRSEPSKNTL
jgi:hypothetical protein